MRCYFVLSSQSASCLFTSSRCKASWVECQGGGRTRVYSERDNKRRNRVRGGEILPLITFDVKGVFSTISSFHLFSFLFPSFRFKRFFFLISLHVSVKWKTRVRCYVGGEEEEYECDEFWILKQLGVDAVMKQKVVAVEVESWWK